jgi:hypothetical protein
MRVLTLAILGLGCVILIANLSTRDDPRQKIAVMASMANKLQSARRIDPETERLMREMIADVRRGAPYSDSRIEAQMQTAIERVEAALAMHTASAHPK